MAALFRLICVLLLAISTQAYRYDPEYLSYNLNTNRSAREPIDYWGERAGHTFHPSPSNWRIPFYTIQLDRFVNGDPFNDNINGTYFEHDINSNQMRHGGDLQGLMDTLDYLQGMGIKGLFLAGSIFMNMPWGYDGYSPVDLSLLDPHFADLRAWQLAIDEIHARGMYVILDNTFATLGDLIGFEGYLNETTPFSVKEHTAIYKSSRQYTDFSLGNEYNATCQYPRFWNETGYPVDASVNEQLVGCYNSDFDQYGDTEAFGVYADWRRQITKFASVQDRLREWHTPVRLKLERFHCMMIAQLDIDGFRYDKALQSTVDALGDMNHAMRRCARRHGKDNFLLVGELTGGNDISSVWLGRGRQPNMLPNNLTEAVTAGYVTQAYSIRTREHSALDGAAFHYSVYRTLTRFLGMDGNLEAGYDTPLNLVDLWNTLLNTNDLFNPNTGEFDPRHMYGTGNQDLFRWPAIKDGTQRQLLASFVTTMMLPGIPLLLWGEEQAFYVLDNTASNYIFGRQPLSSSSAWQTHGCYSLDSTQYYDFQNLLGAAREGCHDDTVSHDHRDPSAPVRNILKHMYHLRQQFPVLNDGAWLQQLSNQTRPIIYPGSSGVVTETGMWSVLRSGVPGVQNFTTEQYQGNTPVWLLYSNDNVTSDYLFDCSDDTTGLATSALLAPFDGGSSLRNLLYPYDVVTLQNSTQFLGINGSTNATGCLSSITMDAYGFKAYVPVLNWVAPLPVITKFIVNGAGGHDTRILSQMDQSEANRVSVQFYFSSELDCANITNSITLNSTTLAGRPALLDLATISCGNASNADDTVLQSMISSTWSWSGELYNVDDGVHQITVGNRTKASVDRFMFRIGQANNPVVFPRSANYSTDLLKQGDSGEMYLVHSAAGADLWRYTTNWGSSYSPWTPFTGANTSITDLTWTGAATQAWNGRHVRVEYFSRMAGSSDIVQEGDLDSTSSRRFPHLFWSGPYNQYGFDAGIDNLFRLVEDGTWQFNFMTEWPAFAQVNVWGLNPDGKPDATYVMGDIDSDSVLDRLPPSSLATAVINITSPPSPSHLAWTVSINDATRRFELTSTGSSTHQIILFSLLYPLPLIFAAFAVFAFMKGFYKVKFNQTGAAAETLFTPAVLTEKLKAVLLKGDRGDRGSTIADTSGFNTPSRSSNKLHSRNSTMTLNMMGKVKEERRTVLIGTMEYDIEDWKIKVKIGGLGVMAQLMGKALVHQDLIWVVPCIGGIDYPIDEPAEPMKVTILGSDYSVQVQYHQFNNIKYVLLDAPVFRQQTSAEPYPARMDDLASAIYYSAWNQCIAQAMRRFPIDLYHINDYHGCIAPLYLLPNSIPVCLSLHNAEFQGLWPMRTAAESAEVSEVFNLTLDVVQKFIQFGQVFNLLHAGASYLRVFQQGFGAVGVSKKYGRRAHLRYPIFWGLKSIGQLPNPDPTDTGEWDSRAPIEEDVTVDEDFEADRPTLRLEAQKWAGLEEDAEAELFVFVGRWSKQKGVDLIADIFPSILKKHPKTQLICIGPVIDLYGKFAAMKLEALMKEYPKRVYSKPEFTALPPCIFSGAEFALIPSRDEPFGLVAVEFGRKGALGVGARVGGLGNMPGWWYTIEAVSTAHLLAQFRQAIEEALSSKHKKRAIMRARSAKQRFPVAQWVENLDMLQTTSIEIHGKGNNRQGRPTRKPQTPIAFPDKEEDVSYNSTPRISASQSMPLWPANGESTSTLQITASRSMPICATNAEATSSKTALNVNLPSPKISIDVQTIGEARSQAAARSSIQLFRPNMRSTQSFSSIMRPQVPLSRPQSPISRPGSPDSFVSCAPSRPTSPFSDFSNGPSRPASPTPLFSNDASGAISPAPPPPFPRTSSAPFYMSQAGSLTSDAVIGDKKDYMLQQVDPFFTDKQGTYKDKFEGLLDKTDAIYKDNTCIEEYLLKSEKEWFQTYLNAKLGRDSFFSQTNVASSRQMSRATSMIWGYGSRPMTPSNEVDEKGAKGQREDYLLGDDYMAPRLLRNWLQIRIGDWPIYSLFLALGQIMAANSYQITLLTGQVGEEASRVYILCGIYMAASIVFWVLFRKLESVTVLTIPFVLYGIAFLILGVARFGSSFAARGSLQNVATGFYAVASASGSLYFSLNFGDEGGATVISWIFRACVIQGTQQIYVTALWFWGSYLNKQTAQGVVSTSSSFIDSWKVTAVCLPIAGALWIVAAVIFLGLPDYYRQVPGRIPSFYSSVLRRKIILWFFLTVIIQNFFLSSQYGRSWTFLWNSQHVPHWQIACLVIFFFVILWAVLLWFFSKFSRSHSWLLPILAVGMGAPRWAQIWWGTSGMGTWLPWTGSYLASGLVSRSLWLWLGLLDTVQSVGIGMILLSTMTRIHVAFTLLTAQVIGAAMTAIARACAPDRLGPGSVFPNILLDLDKMWNAWFWLGLLLNTFVCFGFFLFFRKEQLNKP